MEFSFPPPSPFLALPGEPPVPWTRWHESFQTFVEAVGLTDASAERKKAMLIHSLGTEGQRIFRTLGPVDSYDACVTKLSEHFAAPQSTILRRILFRQRRQQPGEPIHRYVADLRGLASLCKFGTLEDEMIRDQLAEHTNNPKVRERLLVSSDDLTLAKAVEVAFQIESAAGLATQLLGAPAPQLPQSAQTVERLQDAADPDAVHFAGRQPAQARRACGNCGSAAHRTNGPGCPATGQRCQRCGKRNHFARVCRSSPADAPTPPASSGRRTPTTIHSVSASPRSFKWCTVELDGVCLPLLLDTGASRSLLNMSTVRQFFPRHSLTTAEEALYGYGHSKIVMAGALTLSVRYGTKALKAFTFHVTHHGANLMGVDLFCELGFSLTDNMGSVLHVTSPWQQRWPSLFQGLGCLTAFDHQPLIDPQVRPVIQPLRRLPLALRDDVTTELQALLDGGIIERVDASPWVSNLVVAKKKGGGLRPCVDLRSVNKAVIPDKYPLPTVEELTSKFHGSRVFSKLDLRQGYLQVPLHPSSRNLTAFVTHAGVFRYTRMPFGLSSAPSCFQKIMSTIFAGIPGVVVYLDDIVVHGQTAASHDERLGRVLNVLAGHHLTLNGDKCIFAASSIEFVGFRLTADGLSPLHSNIEAVLRLPEPSTPAQLSSFLGMAAYYARFLPHYSSTTGPLRMLLKKDAPWLWTPACSEAVCCLKRQLTSPPVLAHFDPASPCLLSCDASNVAVGAVLSQLQNGVERPIAFASRSLTSAEQKYSVGEREALACVWACERWHMYLYGRHFTLRTDHQALAALLSSSGPGHAPLRIHRWSERLQQYHFTPQFIPGRENVVADLLSRATPTAAAAHSPDPFEHDLVQMLHGPLKSTVSLDELRLASMEDPTFLRLRTFIRDGWPRVSTAELAPFYRVRAELSCWDDVCIARGNRTVVPTALRARILAMAHDGHLGVVKVKQRCRGLVWWPGIDGDIESLVRDCTACLTSGKTGPPAAPPLQPVQWPSGPWEHLQVDICGDLHGVPLHQRFLIVVHDLHSKWPEVVATGSVTTQVVTDFLLSLFARWGVPNAITTDNGPQFTSADFAAFLRDRGVVHIRTALYHPQANGGVERFNQTLKNGIRAHLMDGLPFSAALTHTLLHYRATPHSTTDCSPARLMMGRELRLPLDLLRPQPAAIPMPGPRSLHTEGVVEKVRERQREMKQQYDRRHRARPSHIAVLDWVRVRRPNRGHKLLSFWSAPLQVTQQLGAATFRLADGSRWHAARLRRVAPPLSADHEAASCGASTVGDLDVPAGLPSDPAEPNQPLAEAEARPVRGRNRPRYLEDYVTDF